MNNKHNCVEILDQHLSVLEPININIQLCDIYCEKPLNPPKGPN